MKRILLLVSAFLTVQALLAQMKEGTIVYERKVNMHRRITDEQMKAMVPEYRTNNYQLLFSDSISLFKAIAEENTPDPFNPAGRPVMIFKMSGDDGEQYRNFARAKLVESRPLGAKTYIIEDSIKQPEWKLTGERKSILNYSCRKATFQNQRGESIEAWYTESIPFPAGPENFTGLPGAILQADVNAGEIVFTATSVTPKVEKKEIQEPKKGKKITNSAFTKLMDEMMGSAGPGGERIIRRN